MKNFLILSPHYPQRIYFFAKALRQKGFNVYGIGDCTWDSLNSDLKFALYDYIQIPLACYGEDHRIDENKYAPIHRAVAAMISRHGRMDYLESFNEFWLPLDAKLREDFNIWGHKPDECEGLVHKSLMKAVFAKAGAEVVEGAVIKDLLQLLAFQKKHGDIIVKPDIGVGASDTHKFTSPAEVEKFWEKKGKADYYMEQFAPAKDRELISFDGIIDGDGEVVFHCMHSYSDGIMEVTHGKALSYFNYMDSEIPEKLRKIGIATAKGFKLRKQFFHIEYFRYPGKATDGLEDRFFGLEVNARPPGVVTLDLMNHAKGIDVWKAYADVCDDEKPKVEFIHDWTASYMSRLNRVPYKYTHHEIIEKYRENIVFHMPMDSAVMGDYCYVVLCETHEKRLEILQFVSAVKGQTNLM